MDLTALATRLAGRWLRATVTGQLQTYFIWVVAGALLLGLFLWKSDTWLALALAGAALAVVVAVFVWQLVLVFMKRTEPLKRIERD